MSTSPRRHGNRRAGSPGLIGTALALLLAGCSAGQETAPQRQQPPLAEARPVEEAAPAARVLDPEAREWVERTLAGMSLRQRVAQLVMPWVSGAHPASNAREMERLAGWAGRDEVGGIIISKGSPEAYVAKLNAAQARAKVPLLVVSDLETGPGMRITPGGTYLPPAMAFGAAGSEALARQAGRVTGAEARAVGVHMTLGPVLDVNSNPRNPIINTRSFGEDPEQVARLASAWIQGAREAGLLTAGKHFPGHGDTEVDSHIGFAAITGDSARLAEVELVPFRRAVRAGMDGMLVGHIAVVGLEGSGAPPASLSRRMVGRVLRGELGFQGLVFTDALNMGAVTRRYSVSEASILALQAGADVLLQPPGEGDVIAAVVAAVERGRIPRERIDASVRRVLSAKAAVGLHRDRRVEAGTMADVVGAPRHAAIAERVAEASIALPRDTRGLVPLAPGVRRILHVTYAESDRGSGAVALDRVLTAGGRQLRTVRVSERTTPAEFARLRRAADSVDLVLASAVAVPREYKGSVGVSAGFASFVEGVSARGRPVVAVALGSPYIIDAFPSVPAYLLAWSSSTVSQRAAARALLGEAPVTGRLPVALPPYHLAGEGIRRQGSGSAGP